MERIREFAEEYGKDGGVLYFVGGAVRDALLGREGSDYDITGRLPYEDVIRICERTGTPCVPMSTRLGTLHIRTGETVFEYTPFRTERYAEGGAHRPAEVVFGVGMEDDARRRDFTVNALYENVLTGEILDPLGGLQDLGRRVLKPCSGDTLRSDALRILRLVRFEGQLSFRISEETFEQARENAPLLKDIVPERRWEEFSKILLCDRKYLPEYSKTDENGLPVLPDGESEAVFRCLKDLELIGALRYLFPEMYDGSGMEQRQDFHRYTVLEHGFHTCASAYPSLEQRLAGLLHDIGKPACRKVWGNYHLHPEYGLEIAARDLSELRCQKALAEKVLFLVKNHMYDIQGTARGKTLRKTFARWGRPETTAMILMREADFRGSGRKDRYTEEKWRALFARMLSDGTPFSVSELDLSGEELKRRLGIGEGREIGNLLNELRDHCVLHPSDNRRDTLLRIAERLSAGGRR